MKAQFMVVSAVIGGLIMISLGGVISEVESQTFEPRDTQHQFNYIEREAEQIYSGGQPSELEEANFREIMNELDYRTSFSFGVDHVNVTLERPSETYRLQYLGR